MSLDAMVGRDKANGNFCHLDRSELDDLLDEILGDQLFVSNFTSQGREDAPGVNGKQRDNTEQRAGNGMNQQYNSHTSATDGATTIPNSAPKNQAVMQTSVDFYQRNDPGRGCVPNPPIYSQYLEMESRESHVLPSGRNRAPSLPDNNSGLEYHKRLQSVPCNDYGGQAQDPQNYYAAGSGRFVRGMCSEEPITWLDQQKMKLRTRQEIKGSTGQTTQQKQLIDELKAAQIMCAQKRAELNKVEQHAEYNNSHLAQAQSPTRHGLVCQTFVGNGDLLRAEKSASSSLSLQSETTITSNGENKDTCKSERSYYVSGIERPPFTTHQTKYVFRVSSPHVSGRHPGNMSPTLQLLQKASTKCSPPTPLRGESSRDAMKQSTMVHDWDIEQWEQGKTHMS